MSWLCALMIMAGEIPDLIERDGNQHWVSARLAVQDGSLSPVHLSERSYRKLTRQSNASTTGSHSSVRSTSLADPGKTGCTVRRTRKVDRFYPPPPKLKDLVASAKQIFGGVVIDTEAGFWSGLPATMLLVEVSDTTVGDSRLAEGRQISLVIQRAAIQTDEGTICGSLSTRRLPQEGDRFRIISNRPEWNADHPQYIFEDEFFFEEDSAGVEHSPRLFRRELESGGRLYLPNLLRSRREIVARHQRLEEALKKY